MQTKVVVVLLLALALAITLSAQNKLSGTLECPKADPVYTIPVGDRPDHAFMISKGKCTWTKAPEIAGSVAKEHDGTLFFEIRGNTGRGRGVGWGTTASGDKYYIGSQGTVTSKEGVPQSSEGTWSYTGGTGKLKGIKGKGTYKGTTAADGTTIYEVEGEYQLPK